MGEVVAMPFFLWGFLHLEIADQSKENAVNDVNHRTDQRSTEAAWFPGIVHNHNPQCQLAEGAAMQALTARRVADIAEERNREPQKPKFSKFLGQMRYVLVVEGRHDGNHKAHHKGRRHSDY